jgi:hypothetical protein
MNPKNAHGVSEFDFLRDHQPYAFETYEKYNYVSILPIRVMNRERLTYQFEPL